MNEDDWNIENMKNWTNNPTNPANGKAYNDMMRKRVNGGMGATGMDYAGAAIGGVQALSGVANAYLGFQNYGLAKEKFAAEKATTNADYMAQAMGYNTGLQNSTNVGLALGGGSMTPEQVQAARDYTNSRKLSEKAIV